MLDWIAEKFELMCSIAMVIIFIVFGVGGAIIGSNIDGAGLGILFFIIGVLVAFILNVMTFGFIAQFLTIRKKVDKLFVLTDNIDYMLREASFDEEITDIKTIVKSIEEKIQ